MHRETRPHHTYSIEASITSILRMMYVENQAYFECEAKKEGVAIEQLAAAAIAGMVYERINGTLESDEPGKNGKRRRPRG